MEILRLPSEIRGGYCSRPCFQAHRNVNVAPADGLWTCTRCRETKALSEFGKRRSGRPLSICKACTRIYASDWIKSHPEKQHRQRTYNLRTKFGLTPEQVEAMVEAQGGGCAGCRRPLRTNKDKHVDHDHETGRVRGILCQPCNMALGLLHDNAETLARLAAYLERSNF